MRIRKFYKQIQIQIQIVKYEKICLLLFRVRDFCDRKFKNVKCKKQF